MKRPARLRLLGKVFRLRYVTNAKDDDDNPCSGMVDIDKQRIIIEDGQGFETERDTILHEALHAIESIMDLGLKERQVHALAGGVLAMLRDNPGFAEYLVDGDVSD